MSRTATGPCGDCNNAFNYGKMTYFAAEMLIKMSNDKDVKGRRLLLDATVPSKKQCSGFKYEWSYQ